MGCGTSFAKILLIIFNIIFWLSGAALLGVGIWLLVDKSVIHLLDIFGAIESSGELLKYASYVLIAVGSFVLIVGFFGCCGAIKENRCMLGVYIVLLVLIMGLEIAAGVLAIIYKDKVLGGVEKELGKAFTNYYNKTSEQGKAFTNGLNFAQSKLHCCGIVGPQSYSGATPSIPYPVQCCKLQPEAMDKDPADLVENDVADLKGCRDKVPGTLYEENPTCCVLKATSKDKAVETLNESDAENYSQCQMELGKSPTNPKQSYPNGCVNKLKEWITSHSIILIGVGIGIACLELFGFIFAVCLCRSIGDQD